LAIGKRYTFAADRPRTRGTPPRCPFYAIRSRAVTTGRGEYLQYISSDVEWPHRASEPRKGKLMVTVAPEQLSNAERLEGFVQDFLKRSAEEHWTGGANSKRPVGFQVPADRG